jgi:hypothetical protein
VAGRRGPVLEIPIIDQQHHGPLSTPTAAVQPGRGNWSSCPTTATQPWRRKSLFMRERVRGTGFRRNARGLSGDRQDAVLKPHGRRLSSPGSGRGYHRAEVRIWRIAPAEAAGRKPNLPIFEDGPRGDRVPVSPGSFCKKFWASSSRR